MSDSTECATASLTLTEACEIFLAEKRVLTNVTTVLFLNGTHVVRART